MNRSGMSGWRRLLGLTAVTLGVVGATSIASASQTWKVTSYGVDAPTCGSTAAPCRSIGQALNLAAADDVLQVEPGLYGDLNGDGDFADAGEEHADFSRGCIVCITRPVRIHSSGKSDLTLIDAGGAAVPLSVVLISADHVTLEGFTVQNGGRAGVRVVAGAESVTLNDVVAVGNRAGAFTGAPPASGFELNINSGLFFLGPGYARSNDIGVNLTTGVQARASIGSFKASGNTDAGLRTVMTNHTLASSYQNRFEVIYSWANGVGFDISGRNARFRTDAAFDNSLAGVRVAGGPLTVTINEVANGWAAP
jgi:hypothetical protein